MSVGRIYLSVGSGLSPEQENFVAALESRVKAAGFSVHTVGRNEFSTKAPLIAVKELMDSCDGTIVLALERLRFAAGVERPGSTREETLEAVSLATPWNQIEATLAYERSLPLLVMVDKRVRSDGMLEPNNDWYVEKIAVSPDQLDTEAFTGRLAYFLSRVGDFAKSEDSGLKPKQAEREISDRSIGDWMSVLTPAQFWGVLSSIGAVIAASFAVGLWLGGISR